MKSENRDLLIAVTVSVGVSGLFGAARIAWALGTGDYAADPQILTVAAAALALTGCVLTALGVWWARKHPSA